MDTYGEGHRTRQEQVEDREGDERQTERAREVLLKC